jgi:23S rRNA (uracil1939-C5)-methyltransferase
MARTVHITLDEMAHGGDAVGRHEGQVVFVPLALPGETARVELVEQRKGYARGALVSIEAASPQRVAPPCPYFGRCGGCQWQHAAYPAQLAFKEQIVRSQLVRIGGQQSPLVRPMLGMGEPWRYRNHVQLRIDREGRVGYYALKSHDVTPVDDCPIAHPLLASMWDLIASCRARASRISLRAGVHTGERLAIIAGLDETPPALERPLPYSCLYMAPSGAAHLLCGADHLHERLLGRRFRISADAFFQNNTPQAEAMIEVLRGYLQLRPGDTLLDAYCGGGALGLSLAGEGVALLGIEAWPPSVEDAQHNAQGQATIWQGDVADVLAAQRPQVDAIVLDPPRAGCTPEALAALAATGAGRIAYVSCDPATLARDIGRLGALGYALREVQPVDMFPQTYHIEAVAWLERER